MTAGETNLRNLLGSMNPRLNDGVFVFVNGKKQKTKKGKRITSRVTLIGLKKGRYNVVIKVKLSDGRTATDRRRFKTCTPKGK